MTPLPSIRHFPFKAPSSPFKARRSRFAGSLCVLLVTAASVCAQQAQAPDLFSARSVERARALLGQMTVDEKIGQLTQEFIFQASPEVDERARTGRLGSALFVTDPKEINRLQHLAVEGSRLHIPLIFGFDVIHGFRIVSPVPLALAASWDPRVVENADAAAAAEASAVGINWAFAPMVDIARDPRWGRIVEGAGEDPYLGSAMARAAVRGFQGPAIGTPGHILACAKHFAGYGAAEGGRDYDASYISEAQLQNVYLPPFHAAVDAGAGSLMSAYMDLNDVPATGNRFLLTETLRKSWGFKGFVVSDADAVKSLVKHGFARDPEDAAIRAFGAGVNMEMALNDPAFDHLKAALNAGRITKEQLDAAVLPILETKYQLGLFDHPYVDAAAAEAALSNPAHREMARTAAEKSAVLLRNQGSLLPLAKNTYKKIAVIGPTGSDPMDMTGPWTFVQKNEATVTTPDALRRKLGAGVSVEYAPGVQIDRFYPSFFDAIFRVQKVSPWSAEQARSEFDRAVALARSSDLVLLTMGEHQQMSGEAASASSLELPGDQQKLMEAIVALGKPVVLLLQNGRPLNIEWASEHVPAILEPGTREARAETPSRICSSETLLREVICPSRGPGMSARSRSTTTTTSPRMLPSRASVTGTNRARRCIHSASVFPMQSSRTPIFVSPKAKATLASR